MIVGCRGIGRVPIRFWTRYFSLHQAGSRSRPAEASAPAQDYSVCRWHARCPFLPHAETSVSRGRAARHRLDDLFRKGARTFCRCVHRGRSGPARPAKLVIQLGVASRRGCPIVQVFGRRKSRCQARALAAGVRMHGHEKSDPAIASRFSHTQPSTHHSPPSTIDHNTRIKMLQRRRAEQQQQNSRHTRETRGQISHHSRREGGEVSGQL